jgi:hypothetical protein
MRAPKRRPTGPAPPTRWGAYVQHHLDLRGWTNTDLAHAGDFDRSLVGRWINEDKQASIDSIRSVCRAFGRDIREGLIAAGLFEPDELRVAMAGTPDTGLLSDEQLLLEVAARMARGNDDRVTLEELADKVLQTRASTDTKVIVVSEQLVDELASRRQVTEN